MSDIPALSKDNSRRNFLRTIGAAAAGLFVAPYIKSAGVFAYAHEANGQFTARVAITNTEGTPADRYGPAGVREKVRYLFDQMGGIGDVVKAGDKVAIKINLTGGSGSAGSTLLGGYSITETMWTHPALLQAVGELLIDAGVKAEDISIVDALWDTVITAPFGASDQFGYRAVQKALGCSMVNLNSVLPYSSFVDMPVGSNGINFTSFKMNRILAEANVYVSIPKLKHHAEAGFTCSLKNQVGTVPKQLYTIQSNQGRRQALHSPNGGSSNSYLPESVCDLNLARPVHLAIVDGIMNSKGGEGVWIPTFEPYQSHVLFAGEDPVATDSVGACLMGLDPEADSLSLPGGGKCDNYLALLNSRGAGTNKLREIEIVGDGASIVTSAKAGVAVTPPIDFKLLPNFPNPFNPATRIVFYLPRSENVTVAIFNVAGQELETLIEGQLPAGQHDLQWSANGLASGVYLCRMQAGSFTQTIKMIYEK